jgi:hypothetical protein
VFQLVLEELLVDVTLLPDDPEDVLVAREHVMVLPVLVLEPLVVAEVLLLLLPPLLLLEDEEDDDVLPLGVELVVVVMEEVVNDEVEDELPLVDGEVEDVDDRVEEEDDPPEDDVLAAEVVVDSDELVVGLRLELEDVAREEDDAEVSEVVL